jgi:ferredoxin-NADP reductase
MVGTAVPRRLNWLVAEVTEITDETATARSIVLHCPGWFGHLAGQHVDVRLTAEDGYQAQRSYSIATPLEGKNVTITVELVDDGEVSPYLIEELRVGDRIEVRGPIGGYFVWKPGLGGPLQLIGGGSGVVPLMAMVRARVGAGSDIPVRYLSSTRSVDRILYREELERLAGEAEGFEVLHTLTREHPEGWAGLTRRVDSEMLEAHAFGAGEEPLCFVCGPTPFVEAVATALVGLGHAAERVKTERFGPTGG